VHWYTICISLKLLIYIYPNNFGFKLLLVSMGQHVVWDSVARDGASLSLKRLCGEGLSLGSPFTGDPGRHVKKGSRYGHLSP
jgi:hypothetical protein